MHSNPTTDRAGTTSDEPPVVRFATHGRVLEATIDRPDALNALNVEVMTRLVDRVEAAASDPTIGAVVIGGSDRAFAAGADIAELAQHSRQTMSDTAFFSRWDDFAQLPIPKIAAVAGYALGGGCELAMMCDIVIAADSARFGQPEIRLGLVPGMGGTQRLTRRVGRSKAMDLILTGRMIGADEAERYGLVSRVVPAADLRTTALDVARTIAGFSDRTVRVALEAVDRAEQAGLDDGVRFERERYYELFDTPDAHEGMSAFLDKREPEFHRNAQPATVSARTPRDHRSSGAFSIRAHVVASADDDPSTDRRPGRSRSVHIHCGRTEVAEAVASAMRDLDHVVPIWPTPHRLRLVDHLVDRWLWDGFEHVAFAVGGSEANDTAMRVVRLHHAWEWSWTRSRPVPWPSRRIGTNDRRRWVSPPS